MRFEIEITRHGITPKQFLTYVKKRVDNKGGQWVRSDLDIEYFKAGNDLNFDIKKEDGSTEKSISKPYEMQTYSKSKHGIYNEICEFTFDDEKTGTGYYYLVNELYEIEPDTVKRSDKKSSKAAIYAKHGIKYNKGKIETPIGIMPELLKVGNSKTGAAVRTWSMNQTTCPCHCVGCYADSGCYQFTGVKESLRRNTELAKNHLEFLKRALIAQCETFKPGTEIRIHAVGDFFSLDYLNMWHDIAAMFPALIFWTYTKVRAFENAFNDLGNANIVKSVVPGFGFNFGHCDYVIDMYHALIAMGVKVHICRCGIDPEQHCAGCHKCSECEYVLFVEHSTSYKAIEDPKYSELVQLIETQKY